MSGRGYVGWYIQKCLECARLGEVRTRCLTCAYAGNSLGWLCGNCYAAHCAWHELKGEKAAIDWINHWPAL